MGCISFKRVLRTKYFHKKNFHTLHQSFTRVAEMPIIRDWLPAKKHEQFVAMTCKNNLTVQAFVAETQETLQSFISKDNEEECKPMEDESEECKVTEEDKPEIINAWELMEGLADGETDRTSEKPFDNGDQARALMTTERLKSMELEEYDSFIPRSKTSLWNRKSKMYLYYLGRMSLEIDISNQENNHLVEANEGKLYSPEINLEKHQSVKQNSRKRNLHQRVKLNSPGPISIPSSLNSFSVGSLKDWLNGGEHLYSPGASTISSGSYIPSPLNFPSFGSLNDWLNSGEHPYSAGVSTTPSSGSYIRGDQSLTPSAAESSGQFLIDKAEIEIHSSPAHEMDRKAMTIIDSGVSSYSRVCSNSSLSAIVRENWEYPLFEPELIASFEKELKQVSEEESFTSILIVI